MWVSRTQLQHNKLEMETVGNDVYFTVLSQYRVSRHPQVGRTVSAGLKPGDVGTGTQVTLGRGHR